jgi:hypothetical protein
MKATMVLALTAVVGSSLAACVTRIGTATPEQKRYSLTARVFPTEQRIDVSGVFNGIAAQRDRDELTLLLGDRFDSLRIEIIRPAASAGPASVERVGERKAVRVAGESDAVRWRIRPLHPIAAGEPLTLRFSARGSGETGFLYHVGPDVAFATGWGDPWYPKIEGDDGDGVGDLTVQVPKGWSVVTGTKSVATAEEQASGTFRFTQTQPTRFTFVAGLYTVVKRSGVVPINAWLLSERPHMQELLAGAESMLGVLSTEFGPYAFDSLALVEVPRAIAQQAGFNAFSPRGMLVLNHRAFNATDAKFEYEWLGHEMSHQWFPHALIWDRPGFLYAEEAVAEYGGMRIVEKLGGKEAVRRLRTEGYEFDPIYSAAAYFRLVAAGADEPLSGMRSGINQRNLAYTKGALVFDMLSREMGEREFQEAIRELRGPMPREITWKEFTAAATHAAGRDLDWFFDQWLKRSGAPDFSLEWREKSGHLEVTITQPQPTYRAHLTIEARGKNGERLRKVVEITSAQLDVELSPAFPVDTVVLDPDYEVLRWTPAFRALVGSVGKP